MDVETASSGVQNIRNTCTASDTIAAAVIRKYGLEYWLFTADHSQDTTKRFNQSNYRWVISEIGQAVKAAGLSAEQVRQEVNPTAAELADIDACEPYGLHARNMLSGDLLEAGLIVLALIVRTVRSAPKPPQ